MTRREDFEKWANHEHGRHYDEQLQYAWRAWNAALESQAGKLTDEQLAGRICVIIDRWLRTDESPMELGRRIVREAKTHE
jgi:hypothetical protein